MPQTFSLSHVFSAERMREPRRRRKVNELCLVTELVNRISWNRGSSELVYILEIRIRYPQLLNIFGKARPNLQSPSQIKSEPSSWILHFNQPLSWLTEERCHNFHELSGNRWRTVFSVGTKYVVKTTLSQWTANNEAESCRTQQSSWFLLTCCYSIWFYRAHLD